MNCFLVQTADYKDTEYPYCSCDTKGRIADVSAIVPSRSLFLARSLYLHIIATSWHVRKIPRPHSDVKGEVTQHDGLQSLL